MTSILFPLPSNRRTPHPRGFAGIRTLLVLVLIGILGAIAGPRLAKSWDETYTAAIIEDLRRGIRYQDGYAYRHEGNFFSGTATNDHPVQGFRSSPGMTVVFTALPPRNGKPRWHGVARHTRTQKECEVIHRAIICMER